jgi:hypothetical protein
MVEDDREAASPMQTAVAGAKPAATNSSPTSTTVSTIWLCRF